MSSSVTSVIRSFVVVLSVLSYATAQVPLGVQMVPNPDMVDPSSSPYPSDSSSYPPSYPSNSDSTWSSSLPVETGTPSYGAPPSQYTAPPPPSSSYYEDMPYSSFTHGGYSQMDCGYGYKKGYDGKCSPESWWDDSWGCYQTTIIINKGDPYNQYCPPPHTVTVTDKYVETKTLTVTYTQPIPTTIYNTVTKTDVKTETLHITNTETLPITVTSTNLVIQSKILTQTDTIKETDFVTKTDIKIIPTTYTSIWVKTDVVDKTNTVERTLTSTVVDKKTLTDTVTYLSTSTKTDVSTQFSVATSTTTEIYKETGLAECLYQCDQYKYLKPGNGNQYNTYVTPPAHTPSPTYQPYQYQNKGDGYY